MSAVTRSEAFVYYFSLFPLGIYCPRIPLFSHRVYFHWSVRRARNTKMFVRLIQSLLCVCWVSRRVYLDEREKEKEKREVNKTKREDTERILLVWYLQKG